MHPPVLSHVCTGVVALKHPVCWLVECVCVCIDRRVVCPRTGSRVDTV